MTSRRDVMTSYWHAKLFLALLNIEILIQMWIRDSIKRVSHWSTWQTCYKMSCRHDVMSWRDVMTSFWHIKLKLAIVNIETWFQILFRGSTIRVSHWATLQHVAIDAWRHDVSTWRQHDMESSYWRYFNFKCFNCNFLCWIAPDITLHVTMTSWHHDVMTSCHDVKGWRQHVVKWPNDLPM